MRRPLIESSKKSRQESYDFIRFLAVSMVLLVHTAQIYYKNNTFVHTYPILEIGKHGVCLFFVLSGYLLSNSLDKASISAVTYRKYLFRRILRIYPAYLVVLIILVVIQRPSILQVVSHIFLVHTITRETFGGINYPFWSLSVEFLTYLLIPPMAWIASKYRGLRVFFIASAAGILWQSLGGYFREKNGFDSNYEFSSFFFVLTTIPAFAIGIFARNLQRAFQIFTILKVVCLIIVTFDIVGGVVKTIFDVETRYTIFNNYMRGSASFFVYGIVFLMLIIRVESWNFKNQIFSTCAQIGEMSYSIYLIHVPILLFFAEHVSESLASAFFALIVILFASKVSYAIFEKPFMQISKKEILRY